MGRFSTAEGLVGGLGFGPYAPLTVVVSVYASFTAAISSNPLPLNDESLSRGGGVFRKPKTLGEGDYNGLVLARRSMAPFLVFRVEFG